MGTPRLSPEERDRRLRSRTEASNRSKVQLFDLTLLGQAIQLDRWNRARLQEGYPPFAPIIGIHATAIVVRCPYCRGVHRHPAPEVGIAGKSMVGMHLKERCEDSEETSIGYVATHARSLKLSMREANIAEREGWILAKQP